MVSILLGVLLVLVLTAATGYFVAQEFAYVAVDRARLQQLAEDGDDAARRAVQITSQLSFALSGAQFGITVTALLVGYVSEPLIGEGLADQLGFTGLSEAGRLSLALAVVLAFSTAVQMVLGELAPKNLAIARTVPLARALSRSTLMYLAVAGPVVRMFDIASNKLLRAVGIEPVEELAHGATPEDLHRIFEDAREGGLLGDDVSTLLDRGLQFHALVAEQVMTPRVDVHSVRATEPASLLVRLLDTGHSRFPVIGRDVDDVVGVAGVAELLAVPAADRSSTPISRIATEPVRVPATLPVPALLERLRAEHRQLAVVVDEYGGFAGVVTFEDIAEEVVGDILDEDDDDELTVRAIDDHGWVVSGRLRLDELQQETGLALPEDDDYETLSGLLLQRLGRTAEPGDAVEIHLAPVPAGDRVDVSAGADADATGSRRVCLEVLRTRRHVPDTVAVRVLDVRPGGTDGTGNHDPSDRTDGPAGVARRVQR